MVDVVLTKQRIESGKVSRLKEWTEEIRQREDEAVATLKNEGMHSESAFIESTDDGDFLVYYMEAEDIEQVYSAFEESEHEIDREHAEVMRDVLEDGSSDSEFELLYHMENPERP